MASSHQEDADERSDYAVTSDEESRSTRIINSVRERIQHHVVRPIVALKESETVVKGRSFLRHAAFPIELLCAYFYFHFLLFLALCAPFTKLYFKVRRSEVVGKMVAKLRHSILYNRNITHSAIQ